MKIAVIIPVGPGHAEHAAVAVRSVLAQTIAAKPVVINDTGGSIVPIVSAVDTSGGHGVAAARNEGVAYAIQHKADFVCYLDADDILMPRALEAMLRTYAMGHGAYVYGDSLNILADANQSGYGRANEYDQRAFNHVNIHTVTALVPTRLAAQIPWTEEPWEDFVYWSKFAARGWCGVRTPYPVIAYRMELGARRLAGFAAGAEVAKELRDRYSQLYNGGGIMGCCGGDKSLSAQAGQVVSQIGDQPQPDGTIRMAYTGNRSGAVPHKANGRTYNAMKGAEVYANAEDVDRLKLLGWYVVPAPPSDADRAAIQAASLGAAKQQIKDAAAAAGVPLSDADIAAALSGSANQSTESIVQLAAEFGALADRAEQAEGKPKRRRRSSKKAAAPATAEASE
jgi:hypothetical protein